MSVYLSICWPFLLVHVFVCLFVCLYVLPMKPFWGQESYASCHWTLSPPVFLIGFLLSLTSLVSNFSDAHHLAITGAILRTCFYFMKTGEDESHGSESNISGILLLLFRFFLFLLLLLILVHLLFLLLCLSAIPILFLPLGLRLIAGIFSSTLCQPPFSHIIFFQHPYEEKKKNLFLENQAQTITVMAVDFASIEINNYSIQSHFMQLLAIEGRTSR